MNSKKVETDSVAEPGRRSRWTGDRLVFLGVGILFCIYALVSMLISR